MNPRVLRRFVVLMICLVVAVTFIWPLLEGYVERPPGDYYTEVGSNRLQEGAFEEALKHFDLALAEAPNHRGALMGRAIVFTQTDRPDEAVAEYTHLIGYLKKALPENDKTGRAVRPRPGRAVQKGFGRLCQGNPHRRGCRRRAGRHPQNSVRKLLPVLGSQAGAIYL